MNESESAKIKPAPSIRKWLVLGILAGLIFIGYREFSTFISNVSEQEACVTNMFTLATALDLYKLDYPDRKPHISLLSKYLDNGKIPTCLSSEDQGSYSITGEVRTGLYIRCSVHGDFYPPGSKNEEQNQDLFTEELEIIGEVEELMSELDAQQKKFEEEQEAIKPLPEELAIDKGVETVNVRGLYMGMDIKEARAVMDQMVLGKSGLEVWDFGDSDGYAQSGFYIVSRKKAAKAEEEEKEVIPEAAIYGGAGNTVSRFVLGSSVIESMFGLRNPSADDFAQVFVNNHRVPAFVWTGSEWVSISGSGTRITIASNASEEVAGQIFLSIEWAPMGY